MGAVQSLAIDNQGDVVVGTYGANGVQGTAPSLHRLDRLSGAVTDLLPGMVGVRNAVCVERNTPDTIFGAGVRLDVVPAGAQFTLVTSAAAPWGIVAGLTVVPAVASFGTSSVCMSTGDYAWLTARSGRLPSPMTHRACA